MVRHIWILLVLTNCATKEASNGTASIEEPCAVPAWLLSVEQVSDWQSEPDVVLLDIGKSEDFSQEHIEGARPLWRTEYTVSDEHEVAGMMADSASIRKIMQSAGVNQGDRIVLYDRRGGVEAMRLKWILEIYGASEVYLLNGGLHAWKAAEMPITDATPIVKQGDFYFSPRSPMGLLIQKEDIRDNLENETYLFLDARTEAEFLGETRKKGAARAGRIPGATHLDWMEMIRPEEGYRFLSCEEIQTKLDERGITPEHKIITYCHSGVRSAHLAYVLRDIMGFEQVWNYDGSWLEWSHDISLPVETNQSDSIIASEKVTVL